MTSPAQRLAFIAMLVNRAEREAGAQLAKIIRPIAVIVKGEVRRG